MQDPRVVEMAQVLVDYSTAVVPGDIVVVHGYGPASYPLVQEVHRLCLERQAKYVEVIFSYPELLRTFYNQATPEQLSYFPEHRYELAKAATVYIIVSASGNAMTFATANQDSMLAYSKLLKPIQDERVQNTRWVLCNMPTEAAAQDAKMSLSEYEDYLFAACTIDWPAHSRSQDKLQALLTRANRVRITAPDTEICFSVAGMPAIKCDGHCNIPDGEVYTAPVRDSVSGYITYNTPSIYRGREYNDIRLTFEQGRIVAAQVGNEPSPELEAILDTDPGARYIGEFAIGLNPMIKRPMRDTLFDEKIIGSIHLTPGMCYPDCDNGNQSAVHWDLVKLLNNGGKLYFDDLLVQENGLFVPAELQELNPPSA